MAFGGATPSQTGDGGELYQAQLMGIASSVAHQFDDLSKPSLNECHPSL